MSDIPARKPGLWPVYPSVANGPHGSNGGILVRDHFALQIMVALLANDEIDIEDAAVEAVHGADRLLRALRGEG